MLREGWAVHQWVRVHYLEQVPGTLDWHTPIVFVPGATGTAESFRDLMLALAPRRSIALSLRGRGRSDAPMAGYSFEEHVADIEAVVAACTLRRFCLTGFSMGVPYALGYAYEHPERLAGLIVGDYGAHYPALSGDWVDQVMADPAGRMEAHVARGIQAESREISLWERLPRLDCPVLLLRGGQPDSMLSADECDRYQRLLPKAQAVLLEQAGHALREPDRETFVGVLETFLEIVDHRTPGRE
jgi:pimeloyl-ACP methyl ester carboxylesterase